jgi:hypothetical protein
MIFTTVVTDYECCGGMQVGGGMHSMDFHTIHHHPMHPAAHSSALVKFPSCHSRGSGPVAWLLWVDCQSILRTWHGLVSFFGWLNLPFQWLLHHFHNSRTSLIVYMGWQLACPQFIYFTSDWHLWNRMSVKTLQMEQMAVTGYAEEQSLVADRMRLVFATLEV